MHNIESIMTLVDAHAKDMLRRFSGTKCDPDKSRAAVREALEEMQGWQGGFAPSTPASVVHGEVPTAKPPKAKRQGIFGGKP